MAERKRRVKQKSLQYSFLNDKVHKVLKASRSKDELVAWCYPDKKRVLYSYSQVKKNMEKAYSILEVSEILNKHRVTIQDYIIEGKVLTPHIIYPISRQDNYTWFRYMFSHKNIYDIHEHILESGHSKNVPSKTELQAILKNNIILYTKTDSGFVPVWKAD